MRLRCLLVAAVLAVGCSGSSKPTSADPTLQPSAALIDIPNAILFEGMLLGGVPSREHLERAKELGYKTVVNLRTGSGVEEERAIVEELGMTYVHLPVPVPEGLTGATARALVEVLAAHEGFFLIHCKEGERVAALMALRAACLDGKTVEEAVSVGRRAGLKKLEPKLREVIPAGCAEPAPAPSEG